MKRHDDFNWDTYTQLYYGREMDTCFINQGIDYLITDLVFDENNKIVFKDNIHNNWRELYRHIHELGVKSIYECGLGCGHHLINAYKINPKLKINGCDYSQSQIDLGERFNLSSYPFYKNLKVQDFVNVPDIASFGKHEFVYTQAVTMHLEHNRCIQFLQNMKALSSKYVFLIENRTAHDYRALCAEVFPEFEWIEDHKHIDYGILLKRKE